MAVAPSRNPRWSGDARLVAGWWPGKPATIDRPPRSAAAARHTGACAPRVRRAVPSRARRSAGRNAASRRPGTVSRLGKPGHRRARSAAPAPRRRGWAQVRARARSHQSSRGDGSVVPRSVGGEPGPQAMVAGHRPGESLHGATRMVNTWTDRPLVLITVQRHNPHRTSGHAAERAFLVALGRAFRSLLVSAHRWGRTAEENANGV